MQQDTGTHYLLILWIDQLFISQSSLALDLVAYLLHNNLPSIIGEQLISKCWMSPICIIQSCQVVRFNRILSVLRCKIRIHVCFFLQKYVVVFLFYFYWRGKFALKSARKCYFYMLKIQKVPIVGGGTLPSHTLLQLGRFAPSYFRFLWKYWFFWPKYWFLGVRILKL